MENFLSLRRLSVGYPDRVVLQNIDLENCDRTQRRRKIDAS